MLHSCTRPARCARINAAILTCFPTCDSVYVRFVQETRGASLTKIRQRGRPGLPLNGNGVNTNERHNDEENAMGKYFLAWLLGVPAIVLVLIYFFMH